MPKNIVVCCDTADGAHTSNIVRLYAALRHDASQIAFFYPGLAMRTVSYSARSVPMIFDRFVRRLLEFSFGVGIFDELRAAYRFLMDTYEPGDRLFFFGAGRGGYTVRMLAGILHLSGLLRRGNETLVSYAISMASRLDDRTFTIAREFKSTFARQCPVYFVGVWDSVAQFGWIANPTPLRVPFSINNPGIEVGRHALAIDERRAWYQPGVWVPAYKSPAAGPHDLKQVWFRGSHADVCGGYPEHESGLSKITLEWMLAEAVRYGLAVYDEAAMSVLGVTGTTVRPDPNGMIHNSLHGPWLVMEVFPQRYFDAESLKWKSRINLGRPRNIPPAALIHESVFERHEAHPALPSDLIVERSETPWTVGLSRG
jgi:uncharacterized protein (DUF2235 family)